MLPVALFFYNRPEHAARVLDSLARCRRRDECAFFFYSDGARSSEQAGRVEETRALLRDRASEFRAQVVERPTNLGLARSIVSSVTDLCDKWGRVVVVEDDLVLGPDFLHYMIEALDAYVDDESVYQVSGCALAPPDRLDADAYMLPVTTTWGWGTWARAWKHFSWQPDPAPDPAIDAEWNERFNLGGTVDFSGMLRARLAGQNDSWGILWWHAVALRRGLAVYPAHNLVWNGGFDGSGVHCGHGALFDDAARQALEDVHLPDRLRFPPSSAHNPEHLERLKRLFSRDVQNGSASNKGRARIWLDRIKRLTGRRRGGEEYVVRKKGAAVREMEGANVGPARRRD